jgi:hypothetical protein
LSRPAEMIHNSQAWLFLSFELTLTGFLMLVWEQTAPHYSAVKAGMSLKVACITALKAT